MTTTSRGLGEGPGPTPASSNRRERIMSQKIHEEGSLCRWGGDGPRLVNVPRNGSGHGHDTRREVEWDARPQVLEGRRRTHRPHDCHDAAQSLLAPICTPYSLRSVRWLTSAVVAGNNK